jgi:hypothetical protein
MLRRVTQPTYIAVPLVPILGLSRPETG